MAMLKRPSLSADIRRHRSSIGALMALLVLTAIVVSWGQPDAPAPWLDEGLNWSAARALVTQGRYGLDSADGFRPFSTAIQTGPTVIIPAALSFAFFGLEVEYARRVVGLYSLLAVIGVFASAWIVFQSPWRAVLAVVVMLLGSPEPDSSFVPMARQFLGETAALAWYLVGLSAWLIVLRGDRGWTTRRGLLLILAGLGFGLAGLTKSQMALVLGPSLVLVGLADQLWYRRQPIDAYVVPLALYGAVTGGWGLVQWSLLGPEQFALHVELLRETALMHVLTFDGQHWLMALGVLWRSGFLIWGLPTLIWLGWRARSRDAVGLMHGAAAALPVVGLIWFTLFSFGWPRYAYYVMTVSAFWSVGLAADVWVGSAQRTIWIRRAAVLGVGGWLAFTGLASQLMQIVQPEDDGFRAMRRYLATAIPADAVIETWEWPLAIDPTPRFRFPQQETLNSVTHYLQNLREWPPMGAFVADRPAGRYVLVGPFGAWTGIYEIWVADRTPRVQFGAYVLYDLGEP